MKIKAIFFDLDDTLHDHLKPFNQALKDVFLEVNKSIDIEDAYKKFREASDELWEAYSDNRLSLEKMRIERIILALKRLGILITVEDAMRFQDQYEERLKELELFPEVPELLNALKRKGYTIGIITNGPIKHQWNKIYKLRLTDFFQKELIFVSDEIGTAKPEPEIFEEAARRTKCLSHEMLYIGDSWTNDVVGPARAGWKSIWFNHRHRKPITNYKPLGEVNSLEEILLLL
ncbi:HAD-IA family hydrolase [Neobacillus terrae]|uniref:HAD-IA family hydrolase n=1 Tax=Neobacillus terrae TaxID=3034837 RepID=UPI00140DA467|nr:HAD family hydrolase [Neobacillus terrae]